MLENARQILISELVLARGTEEKKIESMLDAVFA